MERLPILFARILISALVLLPLTACGIYLYSPPKSLDLLNNLFPGDRDVERVAAGASFAPGLGLDVWRKGTDKAGPRPVLIFFYGGSWVKGQRGDYGFVAKAYAARGFVVVIPDYRKVPSVHFPAYIEDGAAAMRWVQDHIAQYGGDPRQIILAGHSAGGYIAMMLALDRHYLNEAGADPHGIRAVIGLAGPYDFYPFDSQRAIDAMGTAPDPRATQPISFARRDAPPLLLVTGTEDKDVKPRNAIALNARERALGNRTTVLQNYVGMNHADIVMALSKPFRGKAPVLDDSVRFIEQALKADPASKAARDF
ncbi:alpha/beta hydrolase [Sphingobium sp.]|uniref:alpha/beta hydrolase n=1 Tax=Sphingobium sp. TaxID=1912891 RepID=UPI0028BD261A|nr:alpha/beta hydrolase [Sphingobium sp.]